MKHGAVLEMLTTRIQKLNESLEDCGQLERRQVLKARIAELRFAKDVLVASPRDLPEEPEA